MFFPCLLTQLFPYSDNPEERIDLLHFTIEKLFFNANGLSYVSLSRLYLSLVHPSAVHHYRRTATWVAIWSSRVLHSQNGSLWRTRCHPWCVRLHVILNCVVWRERLVAQAGYRIEVANIALTTTFILVCLLGVGGFCFGNVLFLKKKIQQCSLFYVLLLWWTVFFFLEIPLSADERRK